MNDDLKDKVTNLPYTGPEPAVPEAIPNAIPGEELKPEKGPYYINNGSNDSEGDYIAGALQDIINQAGGKKNINEAIQGIYEKAGAEKAKEILQDIVKQAGGGGHLNEAIQDVYEKAGANEKAKEILQDIVKQAGGEGNLNEAIQDVYDNGFFIPDRPGGDGNLNEAIQDVYDNGFFIPDRPGGDGNYFTGGGNKAKIDLPAVRAAYQGIVSAVNSCLGLVKVIQSKYFDATNNIWNTPSAAAYLDKVSNAFNGFFGNFNKGYSVLLGQLNNAINSLTSHESASAVAEAIIDVLPSFSRTWAAQSEKFNVPENYATYTYENLTSRVNEIIELIGVIQSRINDIVNAGMGGIFCTRFRALFEYLKDNLSSFATEYSGMAAQKAVEEDEILAALKSST